MSLSSYPEVCQNHWCCCIQLHLISLDCSAFNPSIKYLILKVLYASEFVLTSTLCHYRHWARQIRLIFLINVDTEFNDVVFPICQNCSTALKGRRRLHRDLALELTGWADDKLGMADLYVRLVKRWFENDGKQSRPGQHAIPVAQPLRAFLASVPVRAML